MSTFVLIVVAVSAAVILFETIRTRRQKAKEEALLAYEAATAEKSARAQELVLSCERDLKAQRAAGYGPWLPSLLEGPMYIYYDERGGIQVRTMTRPIAPGVALAAVQRTIGELAGSRFNLDTLLRAEAELEQMWEGA